MTSVAMPCVKDAKYKNTKKKNLPNVLLVEIPSTLHLSVVRDIRSIALHTLSLTKLGLCLSFFGFYSIYKLLPLRIYHALCLELGTLLYLAWQPNSLLNLPEPPLERRASRV